MNPPRLSAQEWWARKRFTYNVGLTVAGVGAFVCCLFVGIGLIAPYDPEFEITIFTIAVQGFGYLMMMGVANLLYSLGYWADARYNQADDAQFRRRLFRVGFWFSCGLPFLIPALWVAEWFFYLRHLGPYVPLGIVLGPRLV